MNRRIAIAESEFQLVIHRADIEELRTVEAVLLLRTVGDVGEVVLGPGEGGRVKHGGRSARTLSTVGEEAETAGDLRPHAGDVQRRTDDLRVFDLVDLRGAGLLPRRL